MNLFEAVDDQFSPALLDRLVDGELDTATRQRTLLAMDRRPELWRQCALAFLEHQAWRGAAKACVQPAAPVVVSPSAPVATARRGAWVMPLAVAASFLLAFTFSLAAQRLGWLGGQDAVDPIADRDPPAKPTAPADRSPADDNKAETSPAFAASRPTTIKIGLPDNEGNLVTLDVPVVEADSLVDVSNSGSGQTLPASVLQNLADSGYEVDLDRRWMTVPLKDGRLSYLPVDEVRVEYVGNAKFQ